MNFAAVYEAQLSLCWYVNTLLERHVALNADSASEELCKTVFKIKYIFYVFFIKTLLFYYLSYQVFLFFFQRPYAKNGAANNLPVAHSTKPRCTKRQPRAQNQTNSKPYNDIIIYISILYRTQLYSGNSGRVCSVVVAWRL